MSHRLDGRTHSSLRKVQITTNVSPYAEGSALVEFGSTRVLITASVEKEIPKWMGENPTGWITAEYGMLPRSTHTRNKREAASGKQGGRTQEIQRLIGRSLRAAVDLRAIAPLTIRLDCDVLVADGGTRTAAITGAWVALWQSIHWAQKNNLIMQKPELKQIAAISAGIVNGTPVLDLCYEEDSNAEFDLNLVFNDKLEIIEIQGTAEKGPLPTSQLTELLKLGELGVKELFEKQRQAIHA